MPLPLPKGLELTWLGTAGFRLAYEGTVIWIDPYVTRLSMAQLALRRVSAREWQKKITWDTVKMIQDTIGSTSTRRCSPSRSARTSSR